MHEGISIGQIAVSLVSLILNGWMVQQFYMARYLCCQQRESLGRPQPQPFFIQWLIHKGRSN